MYSERYDMDMDICLVWIALVRFGLVRVGNTLLAALYTHDSGMNNKQFISSKTCLRIYPWCSYV